MQRTYLIDGIQVGIRTTSHRFGAWLDAALGTYATEGRDGADYSLVVDEGADTRQRGKRDFAVLYKGTTPVIRTLDLPTLGRALLTELSSLRAAERDDLIFLALPALVGRDGAVLVSPRIAMAVGELGRRAERKGSGLPTATFSAVDPATGHVMPSHPPLETPAESWQMLDTLGSARPPGGPRLLTEAAVIDAICLNDRGAGAEPRPRSRAATLELLVARTLNLGRLGSAGVEGLARLVEGARCYDLGRADAGQTLAALATILASGRT